MKNCDECSYKLIEKAKSKYCKPNIYCTRRKCVIPTADEGQWCKFWNQSIDVKSNLQNIVTEV